MKKAFYSLILLAGMLLLPSGNLFAQEPQNTFELAYKSFGVKISVPDGYVAKEVNMIWQ